MRLDHATIVSPDCTTLLRFFVDVAGMVDGPRPAFGVGGYWLYLEGRPVLHLIERASPLLSSPATVIPPARIDHIALRVDSAAEWNSLIGRMHATATPYSLVEAKTTRQQQLFVSLSANITIEFVIDALND